MIAQSNRPVKSMIAQSNGPVKSLPNNATAEGRGGDHNESQIEAYHKLTHPNNQLQQRQQHQQQQQLNESRCRPCPFTNTTVFTTTNETITTAANAPLDNPVNTVDSAPTVNISSISLTNMSPLLPCCNISTVNTTTTTLPPLPVIPFRKVDAFFRGDLDLGLDCSPGARVSLKNLHNNLIRSNHTLKDRVYLDGTKGDMKDAYFAFW